MRLSPQSPVPLPLVLAWRYLRGQRSRLLQRTALAALASIALGVTAMVIAMALMTGYREDLERKLIAGNAAVLAYPLGPPGKGARADLAARLRALPGVTAVGQVAYGQGTLMSAAMPAGEAVTLRGVAAGGDALGGAHPRLDAGPDGVPGVVLGAELARRLEVKKGDLVRLVALGFAGGRPRFHYQSLRLTATFRTGFAEFDGNWMVLARPLVERLTGGTGGSTLFEIAVAEPRQAPAIASRVEKVLGPDYLVTDWQRLNRELFAALRLQQLLLFFLLGLIVLVSTFNVASTLMVLVRERLRDVGVLAALGLSRRRLAAVFIAYGGALGLVGTLIGVGLGSTVAWLFGRFQLIRFDPEVAAIYFVSAVPFRVEASDLLAVTAFSVLFTLLSCLLPTLRVVRVKSADALRYE
ncbi:MAG TPA: FtsX-like permease family protein [Thermoanaerobaculia bacterium]|nr:FtsX-like permease family protein [Thermoanaerobaculia bacterium]